MSTPAEVATNGADVPPPDDRPPKRPATNAEIDGRRKKIKVKRPRGTDRTPERWCRACVQRLARDRSHRCADQTGPGSRCVDCANQNHVCVPVPRVAAPAIRRAVESANDEDLDEHKFLISAVEAQRSLRQNPHAAAAPPPVPSVPAATAAPEWVQDLTDIGSRIANALEEIVRILHAGIEVTGEDGAVD